MFLPTPTSSKMDRRSRPVSKELKLFETLETLTKEDVDPSSSFIQNFVNRDLDLNNTQQSIVEEDGSVASVPSPVKTSVHDVEKGTVGFSPIVNKTKSVSFCEHTEKISFIEEESTDNDEESDESGEDDDGDDQSDICDDDNQVVLSLSSFDDGDNDSLHSLCEVIKSSGGSETETEDDGGAVDQRDISELIESAVMKKHGTEYLLLTEIKRSLELKEMQLERERENFTELQKAEQKKLKAEIQRVENQRKSLQRLIADYHKLKSSRDENEEKMKELSEKLRDTKLEMSKRITRWGEQQRKLEERVKNLEKENQELKKQKSVSHRPGSLKRPPLGLHTARNSKVQSSKLSEGTEQENNKAPTVTKNPASVPKMPIGRKSQSCSGEGSDSVDDSGISTQHTNTDCDIDDSSVHSQNAQNASAPRVVCLSDQGADQTMSSDYIEIKHPCGTITRVTKDNKMIR